MQAHLANHEDGKQRSAVLEAYSDWCGPSKAINATLKRLYFEHGDKGLKFYTAQSGILDVTKPHEGKCEPAFFFFKYASSPALQHVSGSILILHQIRDRDKCKCIASDKHHGVGEAQLCACQRCSLKQTYTAGMATSSQTARLWGSMHRSSQTQFWKSCRRQQLHECRSMHRSSQTLFWKSCRRQQLHECRLVGSG